MTTRRAARISSSKGHTLVELLIAANISVLLLAGMATSIFVASQSFNQDNGTAGEQVRASYVLTQLDRDISQALFFSELSTNVAAFTVPDRDGDDRPETIRYAWSGTPGDPLTYQYNSSSPATLADDVQAFNLDSITRSMIAPVIPPPGSGGGGGGQTVLFVVTDASTPTAQENSRKSLVESWGFDVTLITASDSQANYDAAVATSDVAYISEEIHSSDVGTKLKDATIGVVNGEFELTDEFGFSSDKTWPWASNITIVNNAHYITEEFVSGPLTISSASQSMTAVSGTLAPGLQVLGDYSGANTLVCLSPGQDLYGGGTAAGRRVQLPWGGSDFDINLLTDNGRTLLQRAIEWGAGAGCAPVMLTVQVAQTNDDAEEEVSDGSMYLDSSDLELISDDGTSQLVGIRFQGLNIPSGALITGASIDFTVDETDSGTTSVTIHGQATDNASAFSNSDDDISDRTTTSASVAWSNIPAWNTVSAVHATPDLSAVVQEIVDRPGWSSGNAMAFIITGSGERTAESYDGESAKAPVLRITYCVGGAPPSPSGVVFGEFTEKIIESDTSSTTIDKPPGTVEGDLLIAAVVTNNNNAASLSPPAGWTEITVEQRSNAVTFGVWWKIAGTSESATYQFTWTQDNEESYGWIMRFTGHNPADPIDTWSAAGGSSSSPTSTPVISSVDNAMILRLGGFDDDDITPGDPGLAGHTAINMEQADSTISGGSGYVIQPTAGDSGTENFSLTASEQYRTVTISIAPDPSP